MLSRFWFENLPKGGFATKIRFYRGFDAPGDETGGEGAQILYGIDAARFVAAIALPGGVNSRTGGMALPAGSSAVPVLALAGCC